MDVVKPKSDSNSIRVYWWSPIYYRCLIHLNNCRQIWKLTEEMSLGSRRKIWKYESTGFNHRKFRTKSCLQLVRYLDTLGPDGRSHKNMHFTIEPCWGKNSTNNALIWEGECRIDTYREPTGIAGNDEGFSYLFYAGLFLSILPVTANRNYEQMPRELRHD